MSKSIISKQLNNGIRIELYMDVYGISYLVTAFDSSYRVLQTKRTKDYFNALHNFTILENKYSK